MPIAKASSLKSNGTTNQKSEEAKLKKGNSSKERPIKYEDKSEGQPELIPIFDTIKALLKPYVKGTVKV